MEGVNLLGVPQSRDPVRHQTNLLSSMRARVSTTTKHSGDTLGQFGSAMRIVK